jgi:LemA protein
MSFGVVALAVVAVYAVWAFNRLIRLRQLASNAWADIDVQLKRRHDLIPQVVAVVKGHAGYERGTLEAVVHARSRALEASGPAARAEAEAPVAGSLHRIFALAEAYPDLMAMQSFRELQVTLSEIEDHLQNARRYYNAVVRDLNTKIAQFPSNLVAGVAGIAPREFFGLDSAAERAVPAVSLEAGE